MTTGDFLRLFTYDDWANRECLRAMRASASISARTIGRIAHILSAQKLWLERIRAEKQTLPVWPSSTLDDCEALARQMFSAWKDYLDKLQPNELEQVVEYRNSKGDPWSNRVDDILTHVLMHSAYHRGQIALEMRAAGLEPAYTDFIHAVRNGFLDESENDE